jgi:osmotically-inducible protein OsmY
MGRRGREMSDVRLDAKVARAIARVLRMDDVDLPMLRAFHGVLADILMTASEADEAPADGQLRRAIRAQLDSEGGISNALINFAVKDGEVEIRGAVASEHDRETVLAIVRTVYGVKEVHDHLVWMDRATRVFMPSPEDSCPG